jgi:hypothetical protein
MLIISVPSIVYCQFSTHADSLKKLSIYAWQVDRMVQEIQSGRKCDSLVAQQENQLEKARISQLKIEKALNISEEQLIISKERESLWIQRYDLQDRQVHILIKDRRKQKTSKWIAIIVATGLGVYGISK